jgi:hypothetical protein
MLVHNGFNFKEGSRLIFILVKAMFFPANLLWKLINHSGIEVSGFPSKLKLRFFFNKASIVFGII